MEMFAAGRLIFSGQCKIGVRCLVFLEFAGKSLISGSSFHPGQFRKTEHLTPVRNTAHASRVCYKKDHGQLALSGISRYL
jgi:hypothetical protein